MKTFQFTKFGLLATLVLALSPTVVFAQHGGGGFHGGGGYGGGYHGGGYYGHPRYAVGFGFGYYGGYPGYYYPGYYYGPGYDYPPAEGYYASPEDVYDSEPSVPAQAPSAFWYYCQPAGAYFPYVKECPSGWQAVPAPAQTAERKLQPAPAPAGKVTYRLGDVLFATGQSKLEPGSMSTLSTLLASVNEDPHRHVVIEGHTDATGRNADNLRLSQNRADAVKQYLVEHGVPASRITAVGKGEAGAVADNATAEGRQKNRRVDIIIG